MCQLSRIQCINHGIPYDVKFARLAHSLPPSFSVCFFSSRLFALSFFCFLACRLLLFFCALVTLVLSYVYRFFAWFVALVIFSLSSLSLFFFGLSLRLLLLVLAWHRPPLVWTMPLLIGRSTRATGRENGATADARQRGRGGRTHPGRGTSCIFFFFFAKGVTCTREASIHNQIWCINLRRNFFFGFYRRF